MPTCSWVCKELSALQVSYGFVFPTSGDSTVALRHWNLSQVSVLVFTCNSFWNSWLKAQINPTCSFLRYNLPILPGK